MSYKNINITGMDVFDRGEVYACNCAASKIDHSANAVAYTTAATPRLSAITYLDAADSVATINCVDTLSDKVNEINLSINGKVTALEAAIQPIQKEIKSLKAAIFGEKPGMKQKGPISRTFIFNSVEEFERVYQC